MTYVVAVQVVVCSPDEPWQDALLVTGGAAAGGGGGRASCEDEFYDARASLDTPPSCMTELPPIFPANDTSCHPPLHHSTAATAADATKHLLPPTRLQVSCGEHVV